ncbi:hypothetical protein C9I98_10490 [Photobacterium sanctipauli]|uniref:Uncharacterized protein n=2 Tax=Photobacterium sanctipauli TaxID=1342794 RepID=A0A2T3NUE9_9GAMM|nr:hypothetical protein C9I98_10490 [Photobacterium sanctipauli]
MLPITAVCDEVDESVVVDQLEETDVVEVAPQSQYFIGLRGGASLLGHDDSITLNGNVLDADESEFDGMFGLDFGIYTPKRNSRIYYSYEYHQSESTFKDQPAFDNEVSLHLINADYIYRHDKSITPFAGLHFGYASGETTSDAGGSTDVSGYVFGVQAGLGWQVMDDFGLEVGVKHTVLPSDRRTWSTSDGQGNSVKVESQLKGLTTMFLGATYRF